MSDGIGNIGSYSIPQHSTLSVDRQASFQTETAKVPDQEKTQGSAATAIYYSPAVQIDPEASVAIFVVRNSETGAVINQYPSKQVVDQYKKADAQKDQELRSHADKATTQPAQAEKKTETAEVQAQPSAPAPVKTPTPEAKAAPAEPQPQPVKENA